MYLIGLTGNLFSGHIEVAEIFEKMFNVPVFDADIALKFVLNYRNDVSSNIKIQLGEVYKKGVIDASKFDNTEKFNRLVDIAFPVVMEMFSKFIKSNYTQKYVIFKSSILFERKLEKAFKYIICTYKPKDDRVTDISKKLNVSMIEAYTIIDSEMNELVKNQSSKFIIHNYDKLSLLTQGKKINDDLIKEILSSYNNNQINFTL